MKKNKLFSILCVSLGLMLVYSCEKEEPTEVTVNTRATITGIVEGNIDLTNDFRIEETEIGGEVIVDTIPEITNERLEGVRIFARYNTSQLTTVVDPNHTYTDRVAEAVTNEEGRYTIQIPAGVRNVTVVMSGNDLEIDRIIEPGVTERTTFTTADQSISVTQNVNRFVDFTYFPN